jgi:hypothetical protein
VEYNDIGQNGQFSEGRCTEIPTNPCRNRRRLTAE